MEDERSSLCWSTLTTTLGIPGTNPEYCLSLSSPECGRLDLSLAHVLKMCVDMLKSSTKPKPFRKVSLSTGDPNSIVHRIIKKHRVKFHKPNMVHGVLEDDSDRKVEF